MLTEPWARNPYVGPRPFERRHSDRFFGRDRETSEILSLVIAHPVLLLYAQSGAGKTSLINAGLLPLLEEEEFEILPLARVRGLIPENVEPAEISNVYVFNTLLSWAKEQDDSSRLAQMRLEEFLDQREHLSDEEGLVAPRVLIFDQFEELFAFYPERWQDREGFFEQVHNALEADPLLRVVFIIREDYVALLDPYASTLPEKLRTRYRLERLRADAALSAITGPLAGTGRSFAEDTVETLVDELLKVRVETASGKTEVVTGEFVEPVQLQVVCRGLWHDLPPEVTTITRDHLHAFGDVNQALSRFYQRSIKRTIQESGVREQDLRAWFEKSLITPAGTRGTVYRGRRDTGGIPNRAVQELEDLHLIRGEWRAGARWYELTHDRFIGPIESSNEAWRTQRRIRRVRTGLIAAVAVLGLLVGLATMWTTEATRTVLLEATVAVAGISQAKATAAIEATQVARENQATATASAAESSDLVSAVLRARVRPLKPGLSVSGANGTAGTLGAFVRDAQGRLYLLSAASILGSADCTQVSPDTQVIQPGQHDGGLVPDDVVGHFARCLPLADGASVANFAGLARLADGVTFETIIPGIGPIRGIRTPTPGMSVRKLGRTTGLTTGEIQKVGQSVPIAVPQPDADKVSMPFVNAVVTSPMSDAGDSGALVVDEEGYAIGIVVAGSKTTSLLAPIQDVLDNLGVQLVHAGQELLSLDGHQGRVLSAAWSPDGTRVATAGQDGTAHLWDARTGEELAVWRGHKDAINAVVFGPSGEQAVTASQDGTARLWEAATGELQAILQHNGGVVSAAFSPDGQLLVTGSHDDTARVWEAATGAEVAFLQHEGSVWSAGFSPDGKWVVTASWDDTARVWDVATARQLASLQHGRAVRSAVFSPGGRWILTASSDNTARVWEADTAKERAVLRHEGPVWSAVFSPDGERVATASQDNTARMWQLPTGARIALLHHSDDVLSVRFSPDGSELVTASADGIARVWDATGAEWVFELSGHTDEVLGAAWSPDGIRVLTAGGDGTARIWQGR